MNSLNSSDNLFFEKLFEVYWKKSITYNGTKIVSVHLIVNLQEKYNVVIIYVRRIIYFDVYLQV